MVATLILIASIFSLQASLLYAGLPIITKRPASFSAQRGERARVMCQAGGWPEVHIRWILNRKPLAPNNIVKIITEEIFKNATFVERKSTLRIDPVGTSHSGELICNVATRDGEVETSLDLSVKECGGKITSDTGSIKSMNWPEPYASNLHCVWRIETSHGYTPQFFFSNFSVEYARYKCNFDRLQVTYLYETRNQTKRYCGEQSGHRASGRGREAVIEFVTDKGGVRSGFSIDWKAVPDMCSSNPCSKYAVCENFDGSFICTCKRGFTGDGFTCTGCGGDFTAEAGTITSPYWPQVYLNELECLYHITTQVGTSIQFSFEKFHLEEESDCTYDHVEITYETAHRNHSQRYCGKMSGHTVYGMSNRVTLTFTSDTWEEFPGFLMHWSVVPDKCSSQPCHKDAICRTINDSFSCSCKPGFNGDGFKCRDCGEDANNDVGTIKSLNWPKPYENNLNCTWHITTRPGSILVFKFRTFNTEYDSKCSYDRVQITDPAAPAEPPRKYCGKKIGTVVKMTQNRGVVNFQTDDSNVKNGFVIDWSTED